jgi:DNA-binding transcriptional LysR family regulator
MATIQASSASHGELFNGLLAVARTGNLARAGKALDVDPTTIGRRIRALEKSVQQRLFEQQRNGHALTLEGRRLLKHAEAMERAARAYADGEERGAELTGVVRVSTSEGFGVSFIAPRLPAFLQAHPNVGVDLVAASGFLSPSRKEADIAILLAPPRKGPIKVRRLTHYGLGVYASAAFLAALPPITAADLRATPAVGYIPDFIYAPELVYTRELDAELSARLQSSSIMAQLAMVAAGAGIAVLPCFLADPHPALRRVLPDIHITRSFWLAVHEDVSAAPRVRTFLDWIVAATEGAQETLMGR